MELNNIKVKVKLSKSGPHLAQAQVIFDNILETKGWRIMPSKLPNSRFQEQIWIQPPSYKLKANEYRPTVFVNDEHLYAEVEEKIYNEYRRVKINTPPDDLLPTTEEEVKVEQIPF